ncbi:8-amino-7-oxononanoate synthase [Stenotrophobium rhamnosiphilum]|uniref:8-amino-7-oxononanoate synthase n=1 Tax=Stenotrophobium rhamnosiphilum TaxID=2029166 RepID=A0A2T5MGJ5_9GAMM|nr:8-amino-7-oxononanoate synthase [Stenotrophobium rhamnosiphilum]
MSAPASHVSTLDQRLGAELERIREAQLYRVRRAVDGAHGVAITVDGKPCINFCSNDYLGLASDSRVAEAARKSLALTGTGSGAASLVSGYNREHKLLEEALAAYLNRPRVLLFSTGWAANLGALRALLGKEDRLLADELNHASLIDGGRLSGARYVRIAHADAPAFAQELAKPHAGQSLVATDSIFSMDGDLAPLSDLIATTQQHGATLMVDDAHGFGVTDWKPSVNDVPVYVATLGKSLGCSGAFVAGSETLIEFLIQRARSWVFSTATPPAIAAAAREALRIVVAEPQRQQHLQRLVQRYRAGAQQLGLPLSNSQSAIQPLVVGSEARALQLSQFLMQRGLWVAAIRPPTVPQGTARLRITFSAAHTEAQVDTLLSHLADGWKAICT